MFIYVLKNKIEMGSFMGNSWVEYYTIVGAVLFVKIKNSYGFLCQIKIDLKKTFLVPIG